MQKVNFTDWGLIDYQTAWDKQEDLLNKKVALKLSQKEQDINEQIKPTHDLIFCEHPNVYTLGKSGSIENLLLDNEGLNTAEATFYKINRGGDITYHGPGQLVAYPIFDLEQFFTDIHKYLRYLEESIIKTIAHYGLKGERYKGYTGVWLDADKSNARKICAMGVRCSRWVTMHGLALNVNTDLSYFKNIIPCGIDDKAVTSIEHELGHEINIDEVKNLLKINLAELFQFAY